MSNQSFVVEEYTPTCTCPVCGGKMTPAEYYVAHKGETISGQHYTYTTYKTLYSNIRRKTGGLCTACLLKQKQEIKKKHLPFVIGLGAVTLCGLIVLLVLLVTRNNDVVEKYGFLFAIAFFIAFFGTPVSGYFALDHFDTVRYQSKTCKELLAQEVSEDDLSFYFVIEGKSAGFGGGETLLDRQDVKRMKSL